MKLYDALIDGIDEAFEASEAFSGRIWSIVTTENSLGMAMTFTDSTIPPTLTPPYTGMKLKKLAAISKSWNFIEASIGMAAINAYYNRAQFAEKLDAYQNNDCFCTYNMELKDKNIAVVGHLRMPFDSLEPAKSVYIIEKSPQKGDYPDSACEYILPECDVVLITGSAFVNKTMERLLELSKNAITVLAGPTVPMAPVLLELGIDRACGLIPLNFTPIKEHAKAGQRLHPYIYGKRFKIGL